MENIASNYKRNNKKINMKKLAYIAAPYRADSFAEVLANVDLAKEYGKWAWEKGFIPLVPHVNSEVIFGIMASEDSVIVDYDLRLLEVCDVLIIATERITKGMETEIEFCRQKGIEVLEKIGDTLTKYE